VGERIVAGRYAVLAELGRGGMGVVWRAEDRVIGRPVALKELRMPPGLAPGEQAVFTERVLREARTAGRLNDPAVVTVHDVVREGDTVYLVMELVQAPTLTDLIAREGPLPPDRVAAIGVRAAAALRTAHAAGVVHRDVKPSNIMVLPGDQVKLADFGIAQAQDDPSLTGSGAVMGSPGYLAPELFRGEAATPASDLWSLGATLFCAAEGASPFQRDTTAATLHAIMYEDPRPRRATGPLAAVILGLLTHDTAARLSADVVVGRLEPATRALPAPPTQRLGPPPEPPTARVRERPRTTRPREPWQDDPGMPTEVLRPVAAPAATPWAEDAWAEPGRPPARRRWLLVGAAAVVALALVGVFVALNRSTPNPTTVADDRRLPGPTGPSSAVTATSAAATTSAAPATTTAAPGSSAPTATPQARTTAKAPARGGGLPLPPPVHVPGPTTPNYPLVALDRYHVPSGYHYVTTGSPPSGYVLEGTLGSLASAAEPGTHRLYACHSPGGHGEFVSAQAGCEGWTMIGPLGWVFDSAPAGLSSRAVYRCQMTTTYGTADPDYFVSAQSDCEGQHVDGPVGYVVS
jgi:eukaryotic-like serine/threonine-protein kinase